MNVQNYLKISEMYDKISLLRLEHPEIGRLAPMWSPQCWDLIYMDSDEGRKWFQYYGYAESCLNFCMMVNHLFQREKKAISRDIYDDIFNSLISLLIFENRRFFQNLVRDARFIPTETRAFLEGRLRNLPPEE
ncbi:MAG: hypothetical protein ACTSU5_08155 [Promethearchaeota archaeon]